MTQACEEDHLRDCGNSLGEAGCWVTWTRVATGEMERNGQILHIEEVKFVTSLGMRERRRWQGYFQVSGLPNKMVHGPAPWN